MADDLFVPQTYFVFPKFEHKGNENEAEKDTQNGDDKESPSEKAKQF